MVDDVDGNNVRNTTENQPTSPDPDGTEVVEPDVMDVEAADQPGEATALAMTGKDLATIKTEMNQAIERAQAEIEFWQNLRKIVIVNSRPNHWIRFGDRVRPDGSECLRLQTLLNIEIDITPPERSDHEDEGGKYYIYACHGTATLGPIRRQCYGSASSRTAFFARSHGDYVDVRQINPIFIAKMAWMDALKKGVVATLALDVDPDELEGITGRQAEDATRKFTDRSAADDPEQADQRGFIRDAILELAGGDENQASGFLAYITTFKAKDGKWVKGKTTTKALTQKQVGYIFKQRDRELTNSKYAEFCHQRDKANGDT